MNRYRYTVTGDAADEQTWECSGEINSDGATVYDTVMRAVFRDLTDGKAVFGLPGVGCNGPYTIDTIVIARIR